MSRVNHFPLGFRGFLGVTLNLGTVTLISQLLFLALPNDGRACDLIPVASNVETEFGINW
jgi:hypothetical protein